MSNKVAVMDLGTNTFHLLIAEGDAKSQRNLFKITNPVKLGEGGINKGVIQPAPFERGIKAMKQFHDHILKHQVTEVMAIATSALRSAANGKDFINEVKSSTGIVIETINGDQEADYIYRGVKAGQCLSAQNALILDIGGGSVEFMVADQHKLHWKQSIEIGAARLMDKFHRTDPIPAKSIAALDAYLDEKLDHIFNAITGYEVTCLIGSSGAFETFAEIIEQNKGDQLDLNAITSYVFDETDFLNVTDWLIASSHQERAANPAIIPIRVDMIVVSTLLTRYILKKLGIKSVTMSTNSLKEGVLVTMLG
jgi:exopolyphosphatase/guanosine-5'-triphosphate,3'-diphosphate pyrophosphatase